MNTTAGNPSEMKQIIDTAYASYVWCVEDSQLILKSARRYLLPSISMQLNVCITLEDTDGYATYKAIRQKFVMDWRNLEPGCKQFKANKKRTCKMRNIAVVDTSNWWCENDEPQQSKAKRSSKLGFNHLKFDRNDTYTFGYGRSNTTWSSNNIW